MANLADKKTDTLEQLNYMLGLQGRNERLFYYVIANHIDKLLHIIYQPTVAEYCRKYSLMFRSLPRGLFVSMEDKGSVFSLLKNWPERRVKVWLFCVVVLCGCFVWLFCVVGGEM